MNATLSPNRSPTVKRKSSSRRTRAGSHLPPPTQEAHDAALHAIRNYLKGHNAYDAFPVSFRLIVLDTKLNVKKALQCLLLNGEMWFFWSRIDRAHRVLYAGVVSAPLWNSEKSKFSDAETRTRLISSSPKVDVHDTTFDSAECGIATPFGPPVDPEVNNTQAMSDG